MGGLVCGIDIGSTNIKVLLMDEAGRTVWVQSAASPRVHDGYGIVTDGLQLITALEELIIVGWRAVGGGKPLAAIASAGIGEDGFCVDHDLKPLGHAIPWFDKRDHLEAEELRTSRAAVTYPAINFTFATAAAKWLWLSRHRPEEMRELSTWITLGDFPTTWWSRSPFISATLLPRTGVYDVFSRTVIAELVAACAGPTLPVGKTAGEVVGHVARGELLASGAANSRTLCVSGGHDHPIASSAILRVERMARIDSIGTANALLAETPQPLPGAATAGIDLSLPVRGGPGLSALGPIEFTAPFISAFGSEREVRQLLEGQRISGVPGQQPAALSDAIQAKDFRAILEVLSWQALLFLRRMAMIGVSDGPVYATGGWARSRALMEMRASMFGAPITAIHEPELTALGVALFAAEAASGSAPDFMRFRNTDQFDPVPDWIKIYGDWR